jgi:hypothetical protein
MAFVLQRVCVAALAEVQQFSVVTVVTVVTVSDLRRKSA